MKTLALLIAALAAAATNTPRLQVGLELQTPSTGISISSDGRKFVLYARFVDESKGPQLVELPQNGNVSQAVAYPDEAWNTYKPGDVPSQHFIRINSQRVGPDGALWLVDTGSPGIGNPVILPDGPKLVKIDLVSNKIRRIYPLGNVSRDDSFMDDVRFHSKYGKAYITDAGSPGLVVLDLATGVAKRVLDNHISVTAHMPISADGRLVYDLKGKPVYIHADQLEVSPDGNWLYYQACSGGLYRIETQYLEKAFHDSTFGEELPQHVSPYVQTPSTGGTAIDAEGNIYVSDTDRYTILKIAMDGTVTALVTDERLSWVDAMWIDKEGYLWLPAAQLNKGIPFNKGVDGIERPVHVYKLHIGKLPSMIDHS